MVIIRTNILCVLIVGMCWLGCACATSFYGSAHVEGGRAACEAKCAGQGLSMSGLVYLGEYSSACVCSVAGTDASSAPSPRELSQSAAASAAAVVAGVVMRMNADTRISFTRVRP